MGLLNALSLPYEEIKKQSARTKTGNALIADASPKNYNGLLDLATNIPVAGDVLSGLLAARDAYNGEWGSAGLNALGVLPFVSGTFIGKGAKTWDAVKAAEAAKRIDAGDDVRKVWKETGTFKGPDGHFRQEIDDSKTRFVDNAVKDLRNANGKRQSQIFINKNAYAAYPESAQIWTTKSVGDKSGSTAAYYGGRMGDSDMISLGIPKRGIPNMEELRGSNLHELQHAIQNKEGWAKGGSPEQFTDYRGALERAKANGGFDPVTGDFDFVIAEQVRANGNDPHEAYRRLAGEAEARATQARMNMSMQERLNTYPLDSYDVPINQLIIR